MSCRATSVSDRPPIPKSLAEAVVPLRVRLADQTVTPLCVSTSRRLIVTSGVGVDPDRVSA
jgi:hypothetical protein